MGPVLKLYFELDNDVEPNAIRTTLADRLRTLEGVETADVQQPDQRIITGAEVVATIGAAILIARSAKDALDVARNLIKSLAEVVQEVKGLRAVVVDTKTGPKKLEELTDRDLEAMG